MHVTVENVFYATMAFQQLSQWLWGVQHAIIERVDTYLEWGVM